MKKVVKYFDSVYSFTQYKVTKDFKVEVGFLDEHRLGILTADGQYEVIVLPAKGGDCKRQMIYPLKINE